MASITLSLLQALMVAGAILLFFATTMFFGMFWWDIRTKYNDIYVRRSCTKNHLPIIRTIDGSGREAWIIGDKDKDYDLKFKGKERNVLVDPAYLSKMPSNHLPDGTKIYDFHTNFHFPIDNVGVSGIVSMFRNIRKLYPELLPIRDDFVILELMGKNSADLIPDCEKVLGRFDINEKDCSAVNLALIIDGIKSHLKEWKIEQGFMSINQAVSRLPFGTFAVDISQIEEVTEQNTMNDWSERSNMIMTYGMAALFTLCGVGVLIFIVSKSMGGG